MERFQLSDTLFLKVKIVLTILFTILFMYWTFGIYSSAGEFSGSYTLADMLNSDNTINIANKKKYRKSISDIVIIGVLFVLETLLWGIFCCIGYFLSLILFTVVFTCLMICCIIFVSQSIKLVGAKENYLLHINSAETQAITVEYASNSQSTNSQLIVLDAYTDQISLRDDGSAYIYHRTANGKLESLWLDKNKIKNIKFGVYKISYADSSAKWKYSKNIP